jgi:hypothetical protein
VQTKEQNRPAGQLPSRGDAQARPATLRRGRSAQPLRAMPPGRRCDDLRPRIRPQRGPARRLGRSGRVAPRFPLTSPAMFGMRQSPARLRGRSILALSTMALLALGCCLPVLAQAESSARLEYQDAPPTVPGHTAANDKESTAHKATAGGGSGGDTGSPGGGSAKDGSSDKTAGAGDGGGGDQQGSQGDRTGKASGNGKQSAHSDAKPSASEGEGGSSPLVPILIAIVVLAAISIGVVVMRQRRRSDPSSGSPVSPEAG